MKTLRIHENARYLMWDDGTPFAYLADTAWSMAQKLTRSEIAFYLSTRAKQGFNAVQVAALAEDDGIRKPNVNGHRPFLQSGDGFDPCRPDESNPDDNYWAHLDYILEEAKKQNIVVALLPTWGDKFLQDIGKGPEIFTPKNAYIYGRWLANRYRGQENLLWVLGGDRPLKTKVHRNIIDEMARGLREGDGGAHLITFHPCGAASSAQFVANKPYLDFHSIQSGHGMECYESWRMIRQTVLTEKKPCLDMECRYEDFPACFREDYGYCWSDDDLRQNVYWNMMEGVCGHTYGHRSVWCFHEEGAGYPFGWQDALPRPGASQMRYALELRLSRPYFEFRSAPELIEDPRNGMSHQCAGRGEKYAFLYSPLGLPMYTHLNSMCASSLHATWYNPRNGELTPFACVTGQDCVFVPPTSGKGCDWVLILDVLG